MAKKPLKPVKPAADGGAKKPAEASATEKSKTPAGGAKAKTTPPHASANQPAAKGGKTVPVPSSKSLPAKQHATPENTNTNVKKTSPQPAKKAAAAKSPAAKTPAGAGPKNGSTTKKAAAGNAATRPPGQEPAVRKPVPAEAAEIVIPKKSPFPSGFLKKQRHRLVELRSALLDSMEGVAKDSLRTRPEGSEASVGGMHMGDAGSDAYDRDFALSLLSKEQDALYEINDALKRIDLGSYGICEMTGKPINEERLEALPFARYTREAQESIERDQFGGRNRRVPVRSVFGLDEEEGEDDDEDEEGSGSAKQSSTSESSLDFMKE